MQLRRGVTALLAVTLLTSFTGLVPASAGGDEDTTVDPAPDKDGKRSREYEETIETAIEDIQVFWGEEFPAVYGAEFDPIPDDQIFAAEPGIDLPDCQGEQLTYRDAEDNAFYCYIDNYVAYDDVSLFPTLFRDFGPLSVSLVLAHEWGHAIQDRADEAFQPTILKELQADCFAGAWVARVDSGESSLTIEAGDLDQGLAAMLLFRDAPGSSPDDPSAHGAGFDRLSAFQEGFDDGTTRCAAYFTEPPTIVETDIFTEGNELTGGNLPPDEVIPTIVTFLNQFWTQVEPAYERLTRADLKAYDTDEDVDEEITCEGGVDEDDLAGRVFYCPVDDGDGDGFIAFDTDYFGDAYTEFGDYAVGSLLATAWGVYVQDLQDFPGVETNEDNAVLGADCYLGAFSQYLFDGDNFESGRSSLDPGDLDEAIQALLDEAARREVEGFDVTFVRLRAVREGFNFGYDICAQNYREAAVSESDG